MPNKVSQLIQLPLILQGPVLFHTFPFFIPPGVFLYSLTELSLSLFLRLKEISSYLYDCTCPLQCCK
jgi:hypothetical protein